MIKPPPPRFNNIVPFGKVEFHGLEQRAGFEALASNHSVLPRHTERAAGDLFLQRLNVGLLFKKKNGAADNDAGVITSLRVAVAKRSMADRS